MDLIGDLVTIASFSFYYSNFQNHTDHHGTKQSAILFFIVLCTAQTSRILDTMNKRNACSYIK